jgi:hypothetical protein
VLRGAAGEEVVKLLEELAGVSDHVVLDPAQGGAQRAFGEVGGELGGGLVDAALGQFSCDQRGVERAEADELGAAFDRGEQRVGLGRDQDDQRSAVGFLEGLEERVLCVRVHRLGFFNDERAAVVEGGGEVSSGDEMVADRLNRQVARGCLFLFVIEAD